MTQTVKFTANTTWQQIATGPLIMTISPYWRHTHVFVSNTAPDANTEDNNVLLKEVSGENYVDVVLETGDEMYAKSAGESSILTWFERPGA